MNNCMVKVVLILVAVSMSGCLSIKSNKIKPNDPAYAPVIVDEKPMQSQVVANGSILSQASSLNLFSDKRAYRIGDVITVNLNERTISSKSAETTIEKNSSIDIAEDTLLGRTVDLKGHSLLTNVDQQRDFDGSAEADQENSLQGSIAVTVADILPNGLLVIRGEKWMTLSNGKEYIRLSGLIRSEDISGNNTVPSTKIADARISYSGTGALANANKQGWLGRFFNSKVWPF